MDPESLEAISWLVGLAVAIATLGLLLTGRNNAKRGPAPERRRPSLFDGPLGAPLFQHLVETADPETSALCANFANFCSQINHIFWLSSSFASCCATIGSAPRC